MTLLRLISMRIVSARVLDVLVPNTIHRSLPTKTLAADWADSVTALTVACIASVSVSHNHAYSRWQSAIPPVGGKSCSIVNQCVGRPSHATL